jgi:hypothetical protein
MSWYIIDCELPHKCDFCNQIAGYVNYFYHSGWELNIGFKFLCNEHLKIFKKMTKEEQHLLLLGKTAL